MIGLIASLALFGPPPDSSVGVRVRESAAAAQTLQGPLDGTWTLADPHGRPLYQLQITDPAGGRAPEAAWREAGPSGAYGFARAIGRSVATLDIDLGDGRPRLALRRLSARWWRGWLIFDSRRRAVSLQRPAVTLPGSPPP